jgi:hypothetical protein
VTEVRLIGDSPISGIVELKPSEIQARLLNKPFNETNGTFETIKPTDVGFIDKDEFYKTYLEYITQ